MKIVAICTGNICRSPFAEKLLIKRAGERKIPIEVSSSGLFAKDGNPSTGEAIAVAREFGVDLSTHRARSTQVEELLAADLILPMSEGHKAELIRMLELYAKPQIRVLGEFHPGKLSNPNIPDPIGMGMDQYRRCYQLIQECVEGLMASWDRW